MSKDEDKDEIIHLSGVTIFAFTISYMIASMLSPETIAILESYIPMLQLKLQALKFQIQTYMH